MSERAGPDILGQVKASVEALESTPEHAAVYPELPASLFARVREFWERDGFRGSLAVEDVVDAQGLLNEPGPEAQL